jgi:hypothetical protein
MIGKITRTVLHQSHSYPTELKGLPIRSACFAGVPAFFDSRPVGCLKKDFHSFHLMPFASPSMLNKVSWYKGATPMKPGNAKKPGHKIKPRCLLLLQSCAISLFQYRYNSIIFDQYSLI